MTNTRPRVHPFMIQVADDYRKKVKTDLGFDIPRTRVTYQMADVFDKMIKANGIPSFKRKDKRIGRRKQKTLYVNWEFNI